jgi:hypothetical protein
LDKDGQEEWLFPASNNNPIFMCRVWNIERGSMYDVELMRAQSILYGVPIVSGHVSRVAFGIGDQFCFGFVAYHGSQK